MLSRVTNDNRHGLIDWGPPVGKEWGAEMPDDAVRLEGLLDKVVAARRE